MPCYDDGIMVICTDAESYSASATSIDVVASYYGGTPATWDYLMQIQHWNGSYWQTKATQTGTFSHQTPTKVFSISGLGLPSGSNSCKVHFQATASNRATIFADTPAFIVKR